MNTESETLLFRRYMTLDGSQDSEFENIISLVQASFNTPMAAISVLEGDQQWFKASRGLGIEGTSRDVAFCAHTIRTPGIMAISDARLDPRFSENPFVLTNPGIRNYMGAPLIMKNGDAIGALCIMGDKPRRFTQREMKTLDRFAKLVVRHMELRQVADHDSLTGTLSRAAFLRQASEALTKYQRAGRSASLGIIDLDHFKLINDTYGHAAGDETLRKFVASTHGAMRMTDLMGRLGGEEFGLILADVSPLAADKIFERIRKTISETRFPAAHGLRVTISIGAAHASPAITDADAWFSAADAALYKAKNDGRNQLAVA